MTRVTVQGSRLAPPEERRGEAGRRTFPQGLSGVDVRESGVAHHCDSVCERQGFTLIVRHIEHGCVR